MKLYDISTTIDDKLPIWPGDNRPVQSVKHHVLDIQSTSLAISAHNGTHIDAPLHGIKGGRDTHSIPLETLVGPAAVVQVADEVRSIGPELLEAFHLPMDLQRILFKTRNGNCWRQGPAFVEDYVSLSTEGAIWLRDRGVRLVGIDYLSIERFDSEDFRTHLTLLEAEMVILEGLRLEEVPAGTYELICLPLKLANSDGAPVRAILRTLEP